MTEPNFASIAQEFLADNESFYSRYNDVGAKLSALVEPRYGIFQLKGGEELRDYRFESAERLKKNGLYIDRENYDRVYRGRLREGETLDDIYRRFNIDHPADFRGHSLSVSDIICVKSNGTTAAYYVDSVGFTRVPDFTLDREERKARRTLTDNLTLIAENQLASDEMDDLGEKLFDYENAPNYGILSSSWTIGAGLHSNEFQSLTTRYFNGEDIRAELAQKIYGNMTHIEFYEFPPADGIGYIEISTEKTDSGMTFRTKGGFEITHSWETLGEALITAARQEFDRHEELDRRYREQEEKAKAAEEAPSIKDLEREKKRLETRLQKLIEGGGKTKDTSLTFEQLGFDSLVVDEAHNYKNGLVVSKMNRVSGVQTTPAQKSEDILMKTQFLNENYGEKNIIFATGTPVFTPYQHSNTEFNINACFIGNRHNLNHR